MAAVTSDRFDSRLVDDDADLTAELVLAVLAADLYDHLRQRDEISTSDARASIVEAVESIAGR